MIDDGTLFRLGENNFRWVGGDDASLVWMKEQLAKTGYNVLLKTASDEIHNVAVQGPKSRDVLREILWTPAGRPTLDEIGVFRFTIGRFGGPTVPRFWSRAPAIRASSATRCSAIPRMRRRCGTPS